MYVYTHTYTYTHTHVHTHTHHIIYINYSAIKKNEILQFATIWMDLENIVLSIIGHSKKDKYHMILLICEI